MESGPASFAVAWCVAAWLAMVGLLAAASAVDLRSRRIPNGLIVALAALWAVMHLGLAASGVAAQGVAEAARACGAPAWLAARLQPAGALEGLVAAAVAMALLLLVAVGWQRLRGTEAMGMGDVKLIGAMALFAGPFRLVVCLMAACVLACAASLLRHRRTFPFAPSLAAGFLVALAVGP